MLSFRDLTTGIKKLEIDQHKPVIIHASFTSFGEIRGGVETLLGALLASYHSILAPTFTYKCMLTPETGPENNGLIYGSAKDQNRMAVFFSNDLPADRLMGILSEKIRIHPQSIRSTHPILSFAGINLEQAIDQQTLEKPFAPIQWLYEHQGYVLLLGVDHSVNTSIHLAEQLAGRKSFVRWGLTPKAVYECKNFPGCSEGFAQAQPILEDITKSIQIGDAKVSAIPIKPMIDVLYQLFTNEPLALLCDKESCLCCEAVRIDFQNTVAVQSNA
ncbi:MAG TPA: AAC(3) family N-acetyltransferase [Anaerolineaceae bacterium]|nr:AAC(3) family N-acetyltransferase [Anaerolineaceae bacterium]